MNTDLITKPLLELIKDFSLEKPEILKLYNRVNSLLKNYCLSRGLKLSQLRLPDIFNKDNRLNHNLSQFIARLPLPKKRSEIRHKQYKEEIRSNLATLLRRIVNRDLNDLDIQKSMSFIMSNVPNFLKPAVQFLPRGGYTTRKYKKEIDILKEKERYEQSQISENGCYLLPILIKVVQENQLKNLEELFVDNRHYVNQAIKATVPSKKLESIEMTFNILRKRLKIELPARLKVAIDIDKLPPTFLRQWKLFEERALTRWKDAPEMVALAARNGIKIKVLEKRTIICYRDAILHALSYIPFAGNLDVRDLLNLESTELNVDGVLTTKLYNPLVDIYREHEFQKETKHKRRGFDSAVFKSFVSGIKTLAAYNGIFNLQECFRKNYVVRIDKVTRRRLKTEKKQTFSLEWIDKVIAEFELEFNKIIKENKFKPNLSKYTRTETNGALRFCFFYIVLVTLRFTGFRQQCVRNCVYGKHIVFNSNGGITFRWEADEIKNDKLYEITFDASNHTLSHGTLIRALTLYHNKVYKYLLNWHADTIRNQFFLKLNAHHKPASFEVSTSIDFYSVFTSWIQIFVRDDEIINKLKLTLKPHDFRAFAADWYYDQTLKNIDQTANLLGDSALTIYNEYLRKDQHIATSDLDNINRILRQREELDINRQNFDNDLQMQKYLYEANERADVAEERASQLLTLLNLANQEVKCLKDQAAKNHNELLVKLESLSMLNGK